MLAAEPRANVALCGNLEMLPNYCSTIFGCISVTYEETSLRLRMSWSEFKMGETNYRIIQIKKERGRKDSRDDYQPLALVRTHFIPVKFSFLPTPERPRGIIRFDDEKVVVKRLPRPGTLLARYLQYASLSNSRLIQELALSLGVVQSLGVLSRCLFRAITTVARRKLYSLCKNRPT